MLEVVAALLAVILIVVLVALGVGFGVWWARRTPAKASAGLKRIQLSDGHWAKVRARLTQSMWDAIIAARPPNIESGEGGRIVDASGNDVTDLVGDMVMRALILSGVAEWSYGEIDETVLADAVPLDDQQTLSNHLDAVLSASPLWRRATNGI